MEEIEAYVPNYIHFLNRSTFLYGASGTGKTTIIFDILYHLNAHVDQIIVISPSDPQTGDYSESGIVPKPLIHYQLTKELIENILERQEMLSEVYKNANKLEILQKLFNRLQLREESSMLEQARKATREAIEETKAKYLEAATRKKETKAIEDKFEEFERLVYKKYINKHRPKYAIMNLSDEEKNTLEYINLNPRLILILEDCGAQIKELRKKTTALDEILFRGRHANITLLLPCQDDKNVDSELRKNAFVNIFTSPACANAYFQRSSNGFDKETQDKVKRYTGGVYKVEHQKLVHLRTQNSFHRYTATIHDHFIFGSGVIKQYCDAIQKNGISINKSNKFYGYFNSSNYSSK